MLNLVTHNIVVHYDEPSYNWKTIENDCNWIKLITKNTFVTKSKLLKIEKSFSTLKTVLINLSFLELHHQSASKTQFSALHYLDQTFIYENPKSFMTTLYKLYAVPVRVCSTREDMHYP